jgi:hypothetical protein
MSSIMNTPTGSRTKSNSILVLNGVQYLKKEDYNGTKNNAEFESSWNRLDRKLLA